MTDAELLLVHFYGAQSCALRLVVHASALSLLTAARADERERVAQFVEQAVFNGHRPYSIDDCEGIAELIRGLT